MAASSKKGISFTQVLLSTLSLIQNKKKDLSVSILSFALLLGIVTTFTGQRVQRLQNRIAEQQDIVWEELQIRVDHAMATLSESDGRLILSRMRLHGFQTHSLDLQSRPEDIAFVFIAAVGPWILLSFLLNACILFLASVFFLLLAASASGYDAALRFPMMTFRMIGLLLLSFMRSFIWIPFLGPFLGLWMFPRLSLSPAILAGGKQSVVKSLRESMKRTKGRWFGTAFTLIGLTLLSLGFLFPMIIPISMMSLLSLKLSFFLWLLLLLSTVAFQMFFLVRMSDQMA